jgi:hypothetical protein
MTYEFIENKTLREYYEKEGIELSDEVKAWLMYNNISTFEKRWKYLSELITTITDENFRKEIEECKELEYEHCRKFMELLDNQVFLLNVIDADAHGIHSSSVYSKIEHAISDGVTKCEEYSFDKFDILKIEIDKFEELGCAEYDSCGELRFVEEYSLYEYTPTHQNFHMKFVRLPFPYQYGDIVKIHYPSSTRTEGICMEPDSKDLDEWYDKVISENGDVCDVNVALWVSTFDLDDDGTRINVKLDRIPILFLEKGDTNEQLI